MPAASPPAHPHPSTALVGRERECGTLERLLATARSGASATLVLVGEAGIGKTALLEHAAARAAGMQILRARGIQSEAQIPFASLLELLRPALGAMDQIPRPQALALESALALRPAPAQERFAIGAATLSLLAAHADRGPLAVLVDDAQWLDASSAQALLFAVRRLVADPIAVLLTVREGEPSLADGADLETLALGGLTERDAVMLLDGLAPAIAGRLRDATAGNPLAMLELAADTDDLALAPEGAPLLVSNRIVSAFLRRAGALSEPARAALVLAATSESGDLALLARGAAITGVDLDTLQEAERAGLVSLRAGTVEFRHPLARSAIYADAPAAQRRWAHRALASSLPDRDSDRRAWHLSSAAVGVDEAAVAALAQAGARARERSAYDAACAAFERSARLTGDHDRRARLLRQAAECGWQAGRAGRAVELLDESRAVAGDPAEVQEIDQLAGQIAARSGRVLDGRAILASAAAHAEPEVAVAMLAEAVSASFYAGSPGEMLALAQRAQALLPASASPRARFLSACALGMAQVVGGDPAAGAVALHGAVALAADSPELHDDLRMLPWLAVVPVFLRESDAGRPLLERSLATARDRAAIGVLPFVLCLVALDQATTDRWAIADAGYREAMGLARETGQQAALVFALSGLAGLLARRGREAECRAFAAQTLELCPRLGTRLHEVWATSALATLELGLGDAAAAVLALDRQQALVTELGITDPDVSPAPDLVEAHLRLGRAAEAEQLAAEFASAAEVKGQPWSLARALRCRGLVADEAELTVTFDRALAEHERTPDSFEAARTRLAYGERLRRTRNRVRAREQLRAALDVFDRLGAEPWADRARGELAATGETVRRRDSATADELTAQELQIAELLASGKTTREAAAALFLSPKTIEYHLRHVYMKLGIHSRAELAELVPALANRPA